ncbi:dihydrofolate reductase family protein [Aeromicrobium sp.]|uniref:dihydrofolate reductase family protein n=1 Tax=Aeromicrobium sp. TaxID=1871063 RepID=UPI003D6A9E9F
MNQQPTGPTATHDTEPQTARGKVLMHFSMSLDGFVAGPEHSMDWTTGITGRPGLEEEYIATTGAVLGGRDGWDVGKGEARPYGDAWEGSIFVLTHHPEDAAPARDVTFLDCDVAEAVQIALDAADGKNVEVLSPSIGKQLLELDLHIAPVLLGDGIRLYDHPGSSVLRLETVNSPEPTAVTNMRYRPVDRITTTTKES